MATRDTAPCDMPGCRGRAEPEHDDTHSWMECLECGYVFGFGALNPPTAGPVDNREAAMTRAAHRHT